MVRDRRLHPSDHGGDLRDLVEVQEVSYNIIFLSIVGADTDRTEPEVQSISLVEVVSQVLISLWRVEEHQKGRGLMGLGVGSISSKRLRGVINH